MAKFDHRFWEISVDRAILESMLVEPDLVDTLLNAAASEAEKDEREAEKTELFNKLQEIVALCLTDKQRAVMELYFNDGLTQQEIAARLSIPQQVVSKHLFGVIRNGQRIGGAVAKIRKECKRLGLQPKSGCKNE